MSVLLIAIANLIAKIVTAPFRALGAALGHEASDHDTVLFNAGHSSIAPPEREKLARVAEALAAAVEASKPAKTATKKKA